MSRIHVNISAVLTQWTGYHGSHEMRQLMTQLTDWKRCQSKANYYQQDGNPTQVTTKLVIESQPGPASQYRVDIICEIQRTKGLPPDQICINQNEG
jgi:hypothetical protein